MSPRRAAQLLSAGRVAFGLGLLVAPRLVGRGWLGEAVERPSVQAVLRALGVRDAVIGFIALHTLDHPEIGPRWLRTAAACDAVDAAATLAAAGDLPATGVAGTAVLAGGVAVAGVALAGRLSRTA
jgi:hypothetical protein